MMICLDANCVIYLVEQTPIWGPKISARLAKVIMDGHAIDMSDLTRTECLTGPLKVGDAAILSDYQRFFSHADVTMLPLNPAVCERAAEIRAASRMSIKVPDALHIAAAIIHGCDLFLTHDTQLLACKLIPIEILP